MPLLRNIVLPEARRTGEKREMEKELYLIVGLGNPGEEYAHTRHNAGFEVMDRLEAALGVTPRRRVLLKGLTAEVTDGAKKIVLCRPQTFMNASGECVERLLRWYGCGTDRLLVIYDDIDLPPGRIRVRGGGGPGTHNGMRSLAERLGNTDFARIRVGTGDRPAGQDLVTWVLGHYPPEQRPAMDTAFQLAADCAMTWVREGVDAAMRQAAANGQPEKKPGRKPEEKPGKKPEKNPEKEPAKEADAKPAKEAEMKPEEEPERTLNPETEANKNHREGE